MKLSKLTKPELEEIFRNANFTEEEEKVFKCFLAEKLLQKQHKRLMYVTERSTEYRKMFMKK